MRKIVAGKLQGIHVTEANLNYHGSITLDPDHCEAAGILPMEFVEIWNKNSGARISTYVILGARGSRCCILNGAAARTCQAGDQIIICNSVYVEERQLTSLKPRNLPFDQDNHIRDRLSYAVERDGQGRYSFSILDEADTALAIPAMVSRS
ncbi:Aspartate 1-decarboxylase 2 [Hyphomicrobiales bacterium]|jgi:aspartate 1-decarboxylase|nr:Aspartate 1-decarboxylase 2 [Hyphomicrobiales bacterium]CAH1702309.1 Aspartate 1-decarboxylase 2 [Hyphomicrobiales bacterium]CAI0346510.1 Aspartate 1-decarboxylase 2 [Hyphomicrobiales bacterium]